MSVFFGPVIQQGYVVPDIDLAICHWTERGIGPFFLEELRSYPAIVDGEQVVLNLSAAFAYSGEQQIEVIQPEDSVNTIYSEYLKSNPDGGLQHLGVWVDNVPEKIRELASSGKKFLVRQQYGDRHAYIDSADWSGVMIQLMARDEKIDELFKIVYEGAKDWDGLSQPVRKIDWSTGWPVQSG